MTAPGQWGIAPIALVGLCMAGCAETVHKFNARGIELYEQGRYVQAKAYFNQALVLAPGRANLLFNMGSTQHKLGHTTEAERHYHKCLIRDPGHAKAHRGMAVILAERGQTDRAVAHLEAYRARYPDRAAPYIELAWFHHNAGDLHKARERLGEAMDREPDNAEAAALLGDVYRALDMRPEAILAYRQSLQANPKQPRLRERLAALKKGGSGSTEPVAAAAESP